MALLQVMPENQPDSILLRTEDQERIAKELEPLGVKIESWATTELSADADQDDVLAVYHDDVERLCTDGGYRLVDVASLHPDENDPQWPEKAEAARTKFLDEHTHDEDEVRFFVDGHGCFYLHLDSKVYAVVCAAGDLLAVPANTRHWFDMGSRPDFTAIRFFQEEDGWIGDFTGDPIASRFPSLDALIAGAVS